MPREHDAFLDSLPTAFHGATQVVLFGSRATAMSRRSSDWDLLVVGAAVPRRRGLDLVLLSRDLLASPLWLGSELAGHISEYGKWLVGEPEWQARVFPSIRAVQRKAKKIERRLANLQTPWTDLSASYQRQFGRTVRRDLQRLSCLMEGRPVPPTRMLDNELSGPYSLRSDVHASVTRSKSIRRFLEVVLAADIDHKRSATWSCAGKEECGNDRDCGRTARLVTNR